MKRPKVFVPKKRHSLRPEEEVGNKEGFLHPTQWINHPDITKISVVNTVICVPEKGVWLVKRLRGLLLAHKMLS